MGVRFVDGVDTPNPSFTKSDPFWSFWGLLSPFFRTFRAILDPKWAFRGLFRGFFAIYYIHQNSTCPGRHLGARLTRFFKTGPLIPFCQKSALERKFGARIAG